MCLTLLNLQSNQQIKLNRDTPLIIGRENVEGCFDKRVSRNHGKLTCTFDGKVRLAALHSNPCFFTRNGIPPVLQLKKNEEEVLNEGDCLGLLPNAFWFKVTSNKENVIQSQPEIRPTETEVTNEQIDQTVVLEHCNELLPSKENIINNEIECKFSDNFKKDDLNSLTSPISNKELNSVSSYKGYGTPEFEKTRKLPVCMYEIDYPIESQKSSNKHLLENVTCTKEKRLKVSSETEIKKEYEAESDNESKIEDNKNLDGPSTSKIQNFDDTSNLVCKSELQEEETKENVEKEGYQYNVDDERNLNFKRPLCQYEDNCYRKNTQHKLDFCHPGDPDFVPYEERPLCQYGAACYRRNEMHKIEFRHPPPCCSSQSFASTSFSRVTRGEERPPCLRGSLCQNRNPQHRKDLYHPPKGYNCIFSRTTSDIDASLDNLDSESSFDNYNEWDDFSSWYFDCSDTSSPVPARRKKPKNSDYEDDDEYDLEDPFIDDGSSDEYMPSDLESEEEESENLDASQEDD